MTAAIGVVTSATKATAERAAALLAFQCSHLRSLCDVRPDWRASLVWRLAQTPCPALSLPLHDPSPYPSPCHSLLRLPKLGIPSPAQHGTAAAAAAAAAASSAQRLAGSMVMPASRPMSEERKTQGEPSAAATTLQLLQTPLPSGQLPRRSRVWDDYPRHSSTITCRLGGWESRHSFPSVGGVRSLSTDTKGQSTESPASQIPGGPAGTALGTQAAEEPGKQISSLEAAGERMGNRDILLRLATYCWPADNPEFKRRVVLAVALMLGAKLLNISVPFILKAAVDACTEGSVASLALLPQAWVLGPSGLVLAYGAARAGTALLNETRNMVFAKSNKPPDIDIMNDEGVSIQALADRALGLPTSITAPVRGRAAGHGPRDGSESEGGSDGSMEWRRKLREAESDAEGVVDGDHGLNEGGWGSEQGLGGHTPQEESEDAWADRMWAEMSRRRRAAADQAAAAFASSQASARAARDAATARAARNSAHILQEERARDEAWRRAAQGGRLLQGPGAAAVCDPVCDPGALRAAYEACWARLERAAAAAAAAAAAGGAASHPPQATTGSPLAPPVVAAGGAGLGQAGGAADMGRDAGLQQGRLALSALPWPLPLASLQRGLDPALLREVLLHGVESPADIKRRVRAELLRWHPDKWRARVAPLVRPADLGAAQELADALSQALTQLMAAG